MSHNQSRVVCQVLGRAALTIAMAAVLVNAAAAQIAPLPATRDKEIVANPTLDECSRGWTVEDQTKWTKPQFDQFCAIMRSPAPMAINPTAEECSRGWLATMRWSKAEFDEFCVALRSSK